MKPSKEQLTQNSSRSSSGAWCVFIPFSDTHGVKFYSHPEVRNEAWLQQSCAADLDLAPKAGEFVDIPWDPNWKQPNTFPCGKCPRRAFGYVTELVDVECGYDSYADYDKLHDEYLGLEETLSVSGLFHRDMGVCLNAGINSKGKMVRYDFDPMFGCNDDSEREVWYEKAKRWASHPTTWQPCPDGSVASFFRLSK